MKGRTETPDHLRQGIAQIEAIVELHKAHMFIEEHGEFDVIEAENATMHNPPDEQPNPPFPCIDGDYFGDSDQVRERAEENALSVEYRTGWETANVFANVRDGFGSLAPEPAEMCVLLCCGGPHVEIRAEADGSDPRVDAADFATGLQRVPFMPEGGEWETRMAVADERRKAVEWYAALFAWEGA